MRSPILNAFINGIERIAPLSLAERTWDNVGLILESPTVPLFNEKICRVLLTIDLTESVYQEAVDKKVGIILAYHPPWFRGEKSLTLDVGRGIIRVVGLCASKGISIYSPHSALDSTIDGTNDLIANILSKGLKKDCGPINKALEPFQGCGSGRILTLMEPRLISWILRQWYDYSKIKDVRVALPDKMTLDKEISTIAICVGSGSSVLLGSKADLYFTGEMSHHDLLRATISDNAVVVLTEHTNCERVYLKNVLQKRLSNELATSDFQFEVLVSEFDRDPINIIRIVE